MKWGKNNTTIWISIIFQCKKSHQRKLWNIALFIQFCLPQILCLAKRVWVLVPNPPHRTLLSPAPSLPWVLMINCLYTWCRLALFQSTSSLTTNVSRYNLPSARTASSRISTKKSETKENKANEHQNQRQIHMLTILLFIIKSGNHEKISLHNILF